MLRFADKVDLALLQAVYVIPRTAREPSARLRRQGRLGSLAGSLRRAQDGKQSFKVLSVSDKLAFGQFHVLPRTACRTGSGIVVFFARRFVQCPRPRAELG